MKDTHANCSFQCNKWDDYTNADFAYYATFPNYIEDEPGYVCMIRPHWGTALNLKCNFHVNYDDDGNGLEGPWKGLHPNGVTEGDHTFGCCATKEDCETILGENLGNGETTTGAAGWLKEKHKDKCCPNTP